MSTGRGRGRGFGRGRSSGTSGNVGGSAAGDSASRPGGLMNRGPTTPNGTVTSSALQTNDAKGGSGLQNNSRETHETRLKGNQMDQSKPQKGDVVMMAKYSYKANPDQPGGFPELSVKQAQMLTLVKKHPNNEHWWEAKNEDGDVGFVPASYMMIMEQKPTSLPWLQNREPEEPKEPEVNSKVKPNVFGRPPQGSYKPYKSAYADVRAKDKEREKEQYYCKVCEKQLNGPKPYGAHMASKAHKENVELEQEMGRVSLS
ncbi:PREDICTED: high osmolarity signaling protein SHO1-like isoform X1 [Branchiostoma belcheri]|uniref:High osmolarity signaling protein SHO1-like isoform X1 n=1 Tax=Branchiostoma belcheri TaxID=7741 RepID=A0A6P5AAD2_BRABE|nr:PREDICTED: high osmolarity signaling protein SHO1-like isoform X1 [Branchiostoma belcheri]